MIGSNNSPQGAAVFNSSTALTGSVLKPQSDVVDFFTLAEANKELTEQNAALLEKLTRINPPVDSVTFELDSAFEASFKFKWHQARNGNLQSGWCRRKSQNCF
mgnify:CR=1 FL=1